MSLHFCLNIVVTQCYEQVTQSFTTPPVGKGANEEGEAPVLNSNYYPPI